MRVCECTVRLDSERDGIANDAAQRHALAHLGDVQIRKRVQACAHGGRECNRTAAARQPVERLLSWHARLLNTC